MNVAAVDHDGRGMDFIGLKFMRFEKFRIFFSKLFVHRGLVNRIQICFCANQIKGSNRSSEIWLC